MSNNKDGEAGSALTREEVLEMIQSAVSQSVGQSVNSAITQRLSAFEKKMDLLISKPSNNEQEEPQVKPGRVPNAELLAMKQQLDAMKAEKEMEVKKRRDSQLRNTLREQLLKNGALPNSVKHAIASLVDGDKLVDYTSDEYADDKDRIVFRNGKQEEDLQAGLNKWLKSEEGSVFLAPRGAQGSGDRSYNSNNKAPRQEITNDAIADLLRNAF